MLVVTFFEQMLGGAGLLATELRQAGIEPWNIMANPHIVHRAGDRRGGLEGRRLGHDRLPGRAVRIDRLYEAAAADGAGRWRRLWHITLPGLRPVIVLLLILRLGDALTVGFEQYILQRDAVGRQAAEVLDTFVYYQAIVPQQWGLGAAAGLFKGVVGLVLILVANKVAHSWASRGCTRAHDRTGDRCGRRSPRPSWRSAGLKAVVLAAAGPGGAASRCGRCW